MALPQTLPTLTPEEYLELERSSELRHEYIDGFVYAMAGESPEHSTICFNLAGIVHGQLRGTPCRGYSPNMKVRTGEHNLFSYPDLMVVCGEPRFHDQHRDVIINPVVIFEVLSRSTQAYDRGEKFLRYRNQIETLRDYVLVAQDKPHLEHRAYESDETWSQDEVSGLSEVLYLPSINCRIPLAEVYDRVTFRKQN